MTPEFVENGALALLVSTGWLAPCFLFFCLMIGLLMGLSIGNARFEVSESGSRIYHISELLKCSKLLVMKILALLRIRICLFLLKLQLPIKKTLLKLELLIEKLFLESVSNPRREPHPQKRAKDCGSYAGKEKFVSHKSIDLSANVKAELRRPANKMWGSIGGHGTTYGGPGRRWLGRLDGPSSRRPSDVLSGPKFKLETAFLKDRLACNAPANDYDETFRMRKFIGENRAVLYDALSRQPDTIGEWFWRENTLQV